jgi:hypothetical protein
MSQQGSEELLLRPLIRIGNDYRTVYIIIQNFREIVYFAVWIIRAGIIITGSKWDGGDEQD